jgi:hypothetical protein
MTSRNWSLLALYLLATPVTLVADIVPLPKSYQKIAPGGKFVFVMITPYQAEIGFWNEHNADIIRELRRRYSRSGMYRIDGAEPLWTVDGFGSEVDLTADGVHLIRPGPWAWLRADRTPVLEAAAVSFYANGECIRTYSVADLVDNTDRLAYSSSHYQWQREGRLSGDFEYTIVTVDGNRFVFDVRTGEIISQERPGRKFKWMGRIPVGCILSGVCIWCFWRWRRKRPA